MRTRIAPWLLFFTLAASETLILSPLTADSGDSRSAAYREATQALDEARWEAAAAKFAEVAATGGPDADAALYWKAYCESKLGRRGEARATVRSLRTAHPDSPWIDDAAALGIDPPTPPPGPPAPAAPPAPPTPRAAPEALRPPHAPGVPNPPRAPRPPRAGEDSELTDDEALQLYALDGLMHMDSAKAVPILEKILAGNRSLKIKERALFVLGQSSSPRARQILVETAKSGKPPGIQLEAVRALGIAGDPADIQALADIYRQTSSDEVRRAVLEGWMIAGEEAPILEAAKNEADAAVRGKAVEMLGVLGATEQLAALYAAPGAAGSRAKILEALMIAGDEKRLLELARRETTPELRLKSIEMLGVMGATKDLVALYGSSTDRDQKSKIIDGLMISGDGEALVDLLRKETDPGLKREMVQKLTLMGDDAATDELLRILGEEK